MQHFLRLEHNDCDAMTMPPLTNLSLGNETPQHIVADNFAAPYSLKILNFSIKQLIFRAHPPFLSIHCIAF